MKLVWIFRVVIVIGILMVATNVMAQDTPNFKTVKIGDDVWMAENLNVEMPGGYCYKNDKSNCHLYGRLYIWGIAMKACPSGWHLPTVQEWRDLSDAVGGQATAGAALKESGDSGMNVKLAGLKKEGGFDYFGINSETGFWTSSTANPKQVYIYEVKGFTPVLIESLGTIGMGLSVRCVQDKTATGNTDSGVK